jgi:DNA-binding beta-propeller fold protein YncE
VRAVVDSVNGRVQLLAPDGSVLTTWGSPAPGPTILPRPVAVAFDAGGNAFVLDQRRARIVVFDRATGQPARTIASQGSGPGQLLDPSALAIDAGGTIHVADSGNDRIARFAPDGSYLGAITGVGVARGIAVTPDGARVYVATNGNHITAYSQDGTELADFGGTGSKLGKFNAPAQMALDAAGNLWIADRGGNRVQQLGPEGQRLQSFGERGTGDGQFTHPTGVAIDCRGTLTVTDTDGNRVQQFALAAPAAPACQELAAPASPPPPKLPTLPAPDGPQLSFKPLRSTGVLAARGVPVRVGCDTRCSVTATATLTPAAAPPRRKKRVVVTLRAAKSDVPAGESAILRPVLTSKQAASLRKALRGRRRLVAEVQVVATAAVGAPTTLTQRLAVTR